MPESREQLFQNPQVETLSGLSEEDFLSLVEFMPQAFSSMSPDKIAEFVPKLIEAESADIVIARSPEGKLVSAMVVNIDFGLGKLRGRIDDVATHEEYLRQGYGGAVLDYALDWFRMRGVKKVALTSRSERQAAHRLYESRGFTTRDTNQFELILY